MGGGSGTTSQQTSGPSYTVQSTTPWGPQQGYLTGAWQDAQKNYDQQSSTPYTGTYAAGATPGQYDAYGNAVTQANGQQGSVNNQITQGGQNATAGANGATTAMNNQGAFAAANNPASLQNGANTIASGYNVPAMVQAATAMANRNAAENDIPNLYRGAAAGGNINSDRTALAQGVVERGLAENAQNIGANLANQNYTTGLNDTMQQNGQNIAANSSMGQLGLGLGQGGTNQINSGVGNQTALNTQNTGGANGIQNLNQLNANSQLANYMGPQNLQNQQLQNLWKIIGQQSWGGTKTDTSSGSSSSSSQQSQPSWMSSLGSGIGILGSLV